MPNQVSNIINAQYRFADPKELIETYNLCKAQYDTEKQFESAANKVLMDQWVTCMRDIYKEVVDNRNGNVYFDVNNTLYLGVTPKDTSTTKR